MSVAQQVAKHVVPAMDAVVSPHGFARGEDGVWRRVRSPVLACLDVQLRSDGSSFCVNLGVHFEFVPIGGKPPGPDRFRQPNCMLKTRLGRGVQELWWTDPAAQAGEVAALLSAEGLPFLDRYADLAGTIATIRADEVESARALELTPGVTVAARVLLLALVHEHLGDPAAARSFTELGLARSPPVGIRVQLKKLLERLPRP